MTRSAFQIKLVILVRSGGARYKQNDEISDAGRQSQAACEADSMWHLFSRDDSELSWLNALLDKLCRCVSSALASSQIYILEMTHLSAACCKYPPKKSYVYNLFGLLLLVRSQHDSALHLVMQVMRGQHSPCHFVYSSTSLTKSLNPESLLLLTT